MISAGSLLIFPLPCRFRKPDIFTILASNKTTCTMGFLKDFKKFAMRGNVVDLAVAVVIGGAFGKIVTAMVNDIVMPFVGVVTGGGKFTDRFIVLKPGKPGDTYETLAQAREASANVLAYGNFLQTIVDFILIALCIFIAIRAMEKMKRKEEEAPAAPPAPTTTEQLLMEIRDSLKK